MIDIIILAALSWFIFTRYKKTLGMRIDDEGPDGKRQPPLRPVSRDEKGDLYQLNAERARLDKDSEQEAKLISDIGNPSVSKGLMDIKAADATFNARDFIQGAKMAFEMVLVAYAKGDRDTLKALLSPEVYDDFEREITDREAREISEEVTLVAVRQADITAAGLKNKLAEISVQFVSEQITVDRDKSGAIVGGDPSAVVQVSDEWTFSRDTRSTNPNWTLIAT